MTELDIDQLQADAAQDVDPQLLPFEAPDPAEPIRAHDTRPLGRRGYLALEADRWFPGE